MRKLDGIKALIIAGKYIRDIDPIGIQKLPMTDGSNSTKTALGTYFPDPW